MKDIISIVLVDDHVIVRNGLKSLIEVMGKYKVVAEFDNGLQFINAVPKLSPPDLVVLDLNMPEMNGLETVRWLRRHRSELKVLILTLDSDEKTIIELFRMGVRGYLPKNCTAAVLKKAIEDTIHTGYYHSDLLQNALIMEGKKSEPAAAVMERISDRELEFIKLICDEQEYTYAQISEIMKVHRRTVDGYREVLFEKFHLKSKTGLVMFGIKYGIIKL